MELKGDICVLLCQFWSFVFKLSMMSPTVSQLCVMLDCRTAFDIMMPTLPTVPLRVTFGQFFVVFWVCFCFVLMCFRCAVELRGMAFWWPVQWLITHACTRLSSQHQVKSPGILHSRWQIILSTRRGPWSPSGYSLVRPRPSLPHLCH